MTIRYKIVPVLNQLELKYLNIQVSEVDGNPAYYG